MIYINRNSDIKGDIESDGVLYAVNALKRDIETCFLEVPDRGTSILLEYGNCREECYSLYVKENSLIIQAGSEMGFIYGIYEASRRFL